MTQSFAIVLGIGAAALLLAIPIVIMKLVARRTQRLFSEIAGWASKRGLPAGVESALPSPLAGLVPVASFALDDGCLSVSAALHRGATFVTFYFRMPVPIACGTFALRRRTWGAKGQSMGDAELDRHYVMNTEDPPGTTRALNALREQLITRRQEVWSLHYHERTITYALTSQHLDHESLDRALALLRRLAKR